MYGRQLVCVETRGRDLRTVGRRRARDVGAAEDATVAVGGKRRKRGRRGGRRRVRICRRWPWRRRVVLNRFGVPRSSAAPRLAGRAAVEAGLRPRRLRGQPAAAVVDPHEESAIGRSDNVEIAVAIDVGRRNALKHDVVARRDRSRERGEVDGAIDADDRSGGHRTRERGARAEQHAGDRGCGEPHASMIDRNARARDRAAT